MEHALPAVNGTPTEGATMQPGHLDTPAERLRWARKNRNISSMDAAAEALGIPAGTYRGHENGKRNFGKESARRYARFFHVPYDWLVYGRGSPQSDLEQDNQTVPVVGSVEAGNQVMFLRDNLADIDDLERVTPPAEVALDGRAVRVNGDQTGFYHGDLVFFEEQVMGVALADSGLVGKECVVKTVPGQTWIRKLYRGSAPGLWNLISKGESPIMDAEVAWAARVQYVKRA